MVNSRINLNTGISLMVIEVKHFEGQKEKPWYVIMNDDDRFGVEKFTSKQDAYEFFRTIKNTCSAEDNRPVSKANHSPEFSEYTNHYLSGYVKVVCKLNTWSHYKTMIESYLIPAWQGKTLDQINRTDVKNLILDLQTKGSSPATVENIRAIISGIFSYACEEEHIQVNPA